MSCARGCCSDQKSHYRGLTLSGPSERRAAEKRDSADMDAYARLVRSGVQPRQIDGAAELERGASTTHEVEHHNIITDPALRRRVSNAWESAPPPATTPLEAS